MTNPGCSCCGSDRDKIERQVRAYISRFRHEQCPRRRENIAGEVGLYISHTAGADYNHYALMFLRGIHDEHPVNPRGTKIDVEDFI
jgi:hypothetical protein